MRPRTQKQPQVKKELCQVLDDVDIDKRKLVNHKSSVLLASQDSELFL